jgi:Holliday junction resolvase RusA-like endonuclease
VIVVTLLGEPRGWGRTRCVVIGGQPRFFVDKKTRAYEKALKLAARVAMRRRPLLEGPIVAVVTAVFAVPTSWSRKKRDAALVGVVRPTGPPDWDNVGKMLDAFKGVVWSDDSRVVDGRVVKMYGEEAMLRVDVRPLEVFAEEGDERAALHPPALPRVAAGG